VQSENAIVIQITGNFLEEMKEILSCKVKEDIRMLLFSNVKYPLILQITIKSLFSDEVKLKPQTKAPKMHQKPAIASIVNVIISNQN